MKEKQKEGEDEQVTRGRRLSFLRKEREQVQRKYAFCVLNFMDFYEWGEALKIYEIWYFVSLRDEKGFLWCGRETERVDLQGLMFLERDLKWLVDF